MKKPVRSILLPRLACFLTGEALGSAPEPVRLFVKEVPRLTNPLFLQSRSLGPEYRSENWDRHERIY